MDDSNLPGEVNRDRRRFLGIAVPTITIDGKYDPFTPAGDGSAYRAHFTGKYDHRVFDVGHNVPQEAPHAFTQAVIDADHF